MKALILILATAMLLFAATWGATEIAGDGDDCTSEGTFSMTCTAENGDQIGHYATNSLATGWRWQNVAVPKNATINSATISVVAYANVGTLGNVTATIYGDAIDNAPEWADTAGNRTYDHTTTSASVSWSGISEWNSWSRYTLPAVTTIVQEIVNRPGWSSGNAMRFSARGTNSGDDIVKTMPYSGGDGYRTELSIDYTAPAGGGKKRVIIIK